MARFLTSVDPIEMNCGIRLPKTELGDLLKATVAIDQEIGRHGVGDLNVIDISHFARTTRIGQSVGSLQGAEDIGRSIRDPHSLQGVTEPATIGRE